MSKPAIVVDHMSMMFNLNKEKVDNLKEYFIKLLTIVPIIVLFLLCLGVGMILATVAVFFKDAEYLYDVFCMLLFYLPPIFYHVDQLNIGNKFIKMALMANPLYSITNMFRSCVLYGEMFNMNHLLYSLAFGIVTVAIGLFAFYKKHDKYILHI